MEMGFLNDYAQDIHSTAVEKGWYETDRDFGTFMMLIITEVSEAMEEHRNGQAFNDIYYKTDSQGNPKPEGIPIELADAIIRILDTAQNYDMDISRAFLEKVQYNRTRPHRHGGKVA